MSRVRQLIQEIHRRSLWQVLLIYTSAALVASYIADNMTTRRRESYGAKNPKRRRGPG